MAIKTRACLTLFLFMFLSSFYSARAEKSEAETKKAAAQQVGGLLFDMDEGVKIEQGPGGSVYVKSNREYMQQKFAEIESRLTGLEERMDKLEKSAVKELAGEADAEDPGRKVLMA